MLKCQSLFLLQTLILFSGLIPGIQACTISQYGQQINPGIVPGTTGRQIELHCCGSTDPVVSNYSVTQNS